MSDIIYRHILHQISRTENAYRCAGVEADTASFYFVGPILIYFLNYASVSLLPETEIRKLINDKQSSSKKRLNR